MLSSMWWRNCRGLCHRLQFNETLNRVGLSTLLYSSTCVELPAVDVTAAINRTLVLLTALRNDAGESDGVMGHKRQWREFRSQRCHISHSQSDPPFGRLICSIAVG
jgi:hypothetical protein